VLATLLERLATLFLLLMVARVVAKKAFSLECTLEFIKKDRWGAGFGVEESLSPLKSSDRSSTTTGELGGAFMKIASSNGG